MTDAKQLHFERDRDHFSWHYFSFTIPMKRNRKKTSLAEDIHDSEKDKQKMQPEETIFDLPDVKDIPGQEQIHPPEMDGFVDQTISSDDEEGRGLLDVEEGDILDNESQVSKEEEQLLEKSASGHPGIDEQQLEGAKLDDTDNEGDPLNEENDVSGKDLDVPGAEEDDAEEELGEEDEENNSYSLGADKEE